MKFTGDELSEEEVEAIPNEKIKELIDKTTGGLGYCPECGALTLFVGASGVNDSSECHNCDYTKRL